LNYRKTRLRILMLVTVTLAWQLSPTATVFAQQGGKPAIEKWRPKNGLYAPPATNPNEVCLEGSQVDINLARKSIDGYEWSCQITKVTDTAADTVTLSTACYDGQEEGAKPYKVIFSLKKIDNKTILYGASSKGAKEQAERLSYCPDEYQRLHAEAQAKNKAEVEQKAAEERLRLKPWRPQDGIYATPGANFEDRCLKAGDAIIEMTERTISSGADKCGVTFIRDKPDAALQLFVTCGREANAQGSIPSLPSPETIILARVDDKTIFLQKSKGGNFVDPGQQLSFCSADAQRAYADQKGKK
jgi:hypothetical protein